MMQIELKHDISVPDEQSVIHVNGTSDIELFKQGGKSLAYDYCLILKKYFKKELSDFDSILDFGVGCNRICSWFPDDILEKLTGIDVNTHTIDYCSKTFKGTYQTSNMMPPLDFPDQSFDLIFSFSVFSHLDIDSAKKWIEELHRIAKKDAILLISTHLEWISLNYLNEAQFQEYSAKGSFEVEYNAAGREHHEAKYINIFFTEKYWKKMWEDKFEVVDIGYGKNAHEFCPLFTSGKIKKQLLPVGQSISVLRRK